MLNINIYANYKVHYKCKFSYISQEDSTSDDKVFKDGYVEDSFVKNGGELVDILVEKIHDSYFSELVIENNVVTIKHFNYNSGESATFVYEIVEEKQC